MPPTDTTPRAVPPTESRPEPRPQTRAEGATRADARLEPPAIDLTDADIDDARRRIEGYLDISAEDFRELYRLAREHALGRLFAGIRAGSLMQRVVPLRPDEPVGHAIEALLSQRSRALPVVDGEQRVVGMFTETDLLRCLGVDGWLALLGRAASQPPCAGATVAALMSQPAVCVPADAGFRAIVAAFHRHAGRAMPVVDEAGRLLGLLLRKSVVRAAHLEDWQ